MRRSSHVFALSLFLAPASAACSAAPQGDAIEQSAAATRAATPRVEWPTPDGWEAESIPFPLFFAPDLSHEGVAEVRFTPHVFDPSVANYFSYTFAWVLDDEVHLSADELAADLKVYYTGLAHEFDAAHFDPAVHSSHMAGTPNGQVRGTVKTVDPFNGSRSLDLNVEAHQTECGAQHVLVISVSPHTADDPTWTLLRQANATLQCVNTK